MSETLRYFDDHDFAKFAQPGVAPAVDQGVYSQSLELETGKHGPVHWRHWNRLFLRHDWNRRGRLYGCNSLHGRERCAQTFN